MKDWIIESHDVCKNFIYKELEFNARPTKAYMKKAYQIVKRRIALGGYRLAKIIRNIKATFDKFDTEKKNKEFLSFMQ